VTSDIAAGGGSAQVVVDALDERAVDATEHGREADGAAWEVYRWIDPRLEPDPSTWPAPSEWRTQLIQPIR